jgi:hypothetical protein
MQKTGKSFLQMFAFSFFDGSHIYRFLPILRFPTVPRSLFSRPKTKVFTLIINRLYLQTVISHRKVEELTTTQPSSVFQTHRLALITTIALSYPAHSPLRCVCTGLLK